MALDGASNVSFHAPPICPTISLDYLFGHLSSSKEFNLQEEDANFEDFDGEEGGDDGNEASGAQDGAAGFRAVKQRLSTENGDLDVQRDAQSVQKLLEEYNRLEYEDIVAGMPTKFHYQKVSQNPKPSPVWGTGVCKYAQGRM